MLKRICDRCGKEIVDDEYWFRLRSEKRSEYAVLCNGRTSELCESCYHDFFEQFANNN